MKEEAKKEYALRAKLKRLCKKNGIVYKKLRMGFILLQEEKPTEYFSCAGNKILALQRAINETKGGLKKCI